MRRLTAGKILRLRLRMTESRILPSEAKRRNDYRLGSSRIGCTPTGAVILSECNEPKDLPLGFGTVPFIYGKILRGKPLRMTGSR